MILDSRHTLDEYTGKQLLPALSSPGKEQTVKRGGAIPGAIFSPWSKYAGNKGGEPNKPTLREKDDLAKQLQKLEKNGYAPSKTVITRKTTRPIPVHIRARWKMLPGSRTVVPASMLFV